MINKTATNYYTGPMLTDADAQETAFTWKQRESLRGWLDIELTALARNHYIGAFVYVVVAIAANFTAFALLAYVDWFIYDIFGGSGTPGWIFVASASTLAAAYPLYFWRYHDSEATTQLEYGGDLKISQRGFEASRADPTVGSGIGGLRVLRSEVLLYPVWASAQILIHLRHARNLKSANRSVTARVLEHIVLKDRRVQIHDLDAALREPELAGVIHALEGVHGVMFFTRDQLAISLNDDLAFRIKQAANTSG